MRKILCILLAVCCCMGLFACKKQEEIPEDSVTVYYKREKPVFGAADGVIAATYLDAAGYRDDPAHLLEKYLSANPGEGFVSPFPSGVVLVSYKMEGLTAKVVLSDTIAQLSGMELTMALTCLTHTVMSMSGCREVIISAATEQLDGENFVTLSQDSFLLLDGSGTDSN